MNSVAVETIGGSGWLVGVSSGSWPDWLVALTALFGAIFGILQLRRIAESNRGQVSIARAKLMLAIDARYESIEMMETRLAIRTLRNHCDAKAAIQIRAGAHDREMFAKSAVLFSEEVSTVYRRYKTADPLVPPPNDLTRQPSDQDGERYYRLMRLPNWMETVASLTRDGLLHVDDVLTSTTWCSLAFWAASRSI